MEKSPEQQLVREIVFFVWRKMPGRTEASKNSSTDRRYKKLPSPKHKKTMSSAGRGDARPSNKAGGGGRGGGGGGSHSSKKESILELAKVSSAPFVVYPSIGVVCSARPPDCAHVIHRIDVSSLVLISRLYCLCLTRFVEFILASTSADGFHRTSEMPGGERTPGGVARVRRAR